MPARDRLSWSDLLLSAGGAPMPSGAGVMNSAASCAAAEDAAANGILGNQAEEPLDQVGPGCGRGGKVQMEAGVPFQPGLHLGVLMGGIVIDHQMQVESFGEVPIYRSQKAQEFLVTVPRHALADDLSGCNLECGEQSCRSVTLVVMRHRAGADPSSARCTECRYAPRFEQGCC